MYISTKEAAQRWGISERRVRVLCQEGRIDGAMKSSWAYLIPSDAQKPRDGRQLRHRRQTHSSSTRIDLAHLEAVQAEKSEEFAERCIAALPSFLLASFALASIRVSDADLTAIAAQRFSNELEFAPTILLTNMRSLLQSYVRYYQRGVPIPPLGETALLEAMERLGQGLEPLGGWQIDEREVVAEALEVLVLQDNREFFDAPVLERALFWYAEIIRIAPFSAYNELLAAVIYAQILIGGGWVPSLGSLEEIDEVRAALILTQRRGQYRHLIEVVAESYRSLTENSG